MHSGFLGGIAGVSCHQRERGRTGNVQVELAIEVRNGTAGRVFHLNHYTNDGLAGSRVHHRSVQADILRLKGTTGKEKSEKESELFQVEVGLDERIDRANIVGCGE